MSTGVITGEDCGYVHAVDTLMGVGESMMQQTPPAMKAQPLVGRRVDDTTTSESESESDGKAKKRPRAPETPDTSCSSDQSPSAKRAKPSADKIKLDFERIWELMREREESAIYRIVPNYPDTRWWLNQLPPGSRRKAVNMIYLMAHKLNLEVGTPSAAVILMDRFLSAIKTPIPSHKILFVAAVCLNMAGKLVDIDRGYCGGRAVMQLMRDMMPQAIRQKTEIAFAVSVGDMEAYIMQCMANRMLEIPPALQCISEITDWDSRDYVAWLHAAFICDVFSVDTASTNFLQCDIARAVVEELCGAETERTPLTRAMSRAKSIFVASGKEQAYSDPYFGVRMRHSLNPCLPLIF